MKHGSALNGQSDFLSPIDPCSAYHQAGRAAAIYLNNKQKRLPAMHFQISIKDQEEQVEQRLSRSKRLSQYRIKIDGGRLIQSLPLSYAQTTQGLTITQQQEYLSAFEADVVNILVGPLAEAKYVALCDDEVFNANLVYLGALKFYDGDKDIDTVNEYLECMIVDRHERDRKLADLFLTAYGFINNRSNWQAISILAQYILHQSKGIIHCDEVITLLESSRLAA